MASEPVLSDDGLSANLDLMRAVAVLLVLAQHLLRRFQIYQLGSITTSCLGRFGVLLFFVHTCLVLMYSMQRSGLDHVNLFRTFYIRRIFRIYPLSILTVLCALLLGLDSDINGVAGLSYAPWPGKTTIVSNFLLVQNLFFTKSIVNVLWSLPFELQMYLLLPFLFLWVRRRSRLKILLSLWALSVIAAGVQSHTHSLARLSILRFLPNFLPGVIAFVLPNRPHLKSFLWPLFLVALVLIYSVWPEDPSGWASCLLLGLLIPRFKQITACPARLIAGKIATYSYGIYLSHPFCIWLAFGVWSTHPAWQRIVLFTVLLSGLPILLYHTIERPLIRVGMRIANGGHLHINPKTTTCTDTSPIVAEPLNAA
jgi:peptidoglycan/LPS O-acetylase OafA/YrhL